jgi:hypothetical protein
MSRPVALITSGVFTLFLLIKTRLSNWNKHSRSATVCSRRAARSLTHNARNGWDNCKPSSPKAKPI